MSTMQVTSPGLSAVELMAMNRIHFQRDSGEVAKKSIPLWSRVSAPPFLTLGGSATNPALKYIVNFDTGHTNPVISLPGEEMTEWVNEEDGELGQFLSFLDAQMKSHPEWIQPADEDQLDRLAKLLVNVKV